MLLMAAETRARWWSDSPTGRGIEEPCVQFQPEEGMWQLKQDHGTQSLSRSEHPTDISLSIVDQTRFNVPRPSLC